MLTASAEATIGAAPRTITPHPSLLTERPLPNTVFHPIPVFTHHPHRGTRHSLFATPPRPNQTAVDIAVDPTTLGPRAPLPLLLTRVSALDAIATPIIGVVVVVVVVVAVLVLAVAVVVVVVVAVLVLAVVVVAVVVE